MKVIFQKDLEEEYVLLASMIKWLVLSVFIGFIVGGATSMFIKLVNISTNFSYSFKYYYLLMPIGFFLSSFIVIKLAPDAKGHGTEKAIEAINKNIGKMNLKVVPVKLVTTLITLICGGSVGLEGPSTQIGAGIASKISDILKLKDTDRKKVAVCGIASGFVGVFGSPVGAAVFASEVLYIGRFSYISLFPSLISAFVSFSIGRFLGTKPLISYFIDMNNFTSSKILIRMIMFGLIIGILSAIFIRFVNFVESLFNKINIYPPLKGLIGGALIILIVFITGTTDYLGIGEEVILKSVTGHSMINSNFIWKSITTSLTLGSGGSGGILTPMLYIGSSIGNLWSHIINGSPSFYAAVGMVTFMATCSNTPIAGIVICMELFGSQVGIYSSIVCVIGYLMVGHKSIYPTQILVRSKTPSLFMDTNCEVRKVDRKIKISNPHLKISYKNTNKKFTKF
ncbi:chloride channel protein [Clostridium sp. MB40-C1]|uniref:chloride channel protein n=1 Tax=Clostridium sp. MB40-C1 TaxID=3070996 RepID=UPI0027E19131|nr:chloride channel protein [Clostridium sp. MB40-C1]WMJ79150.1 chloride channel protein [Clostridium sp. MB40-C1]